MEINQYYEYPYDDQIIFEMILRSKTVELHSRLNDIDLDTKADIREVMRQAGITISQLIQHASKRK